MSASLEQGPWNRYQNQRGRQMKTLWLQRKHCTDNVQWQCTTFNVQWQCRTTMYNVHVIAENFVDKLYHQPGLPTVPGEQMLALSSRLLRRHQCRVSLRTFLFFVLLGGHGHGHSFCGNKTLAFGQLTQLARWDYYWINQLKFPPSVSLNSSTMLLK